jgi:uncharacterized membrane protein
VPFAVVWVVQTLRSEDGSKLSKRAKDSLGAFVVGLGAGFFVPNIPFLLWGPGDWFKSVLSPAFGDMVADGHGLALLVARDLVGLPSGVFAGLVIVGVIAGLVVYARYFDRFQNLLWVIPPVIMFLSYRSLHSYFVFWLPIAVLWLDLRTDSRPGGPMLTAS